MSESRSEIAFAKGNRATFESFVASFQVFPLPAADTPDQFEALIKIMTMESTHSGRFELQQEKIKYSDERSYPCVRYQAVEIDKNPAPPQKPLTLELDGLYCRHPVKPESGFAIIYSYRGPREYPNLRTEAEDFIQGVQVPGK